VPLQALSMGTPVIATNFDGPATYLTQDNAILIEPSGYEDIALVFSPDGRVLNIAPDGVPDPELGVDSWAIVNPEDIVTALRKAYSERGTVHEQARIAAGFATAKEHSWERAAECFVGAVQAHIGPIRKRPLRRRVARAKGGLTVAAPAKNGQVDLECLCASFRNTDWPGKREVLILDDASDTPLVVPDFAQDYCRIIRSDAWIGEGAGRDWLMREASGEFIFMTDVDVEFRQADWALRLADGLPEKTIRHPLMLFGERRGADYPGRIWSDGGCYKAYGGNAHPSYHFNVNKRLEEVEPHEGPCVYAPGAGWFMRTEEALEYWEWIGGYYPLLFADVDMAFWLRAHGFGFVSVPQAVVIHHQGSFTVNQSKMEVERHKYQEHYPAFRSWWEFMIEDDLARGAHVCRL
jgi:GT2 family glycosyltransferase